MGTMKSITTRKELSDHFLRGLEAFDNDEERHYFDDHHAIAEAILTEAFETIEKMEELNRWPDSYSLLWSYREVFNND